MTLRPTVVRYTNTFLCSADSILSEDNLNLLTATLSENALDGIRSNEIENLYYIEWPYNDDDSENSYRVWYIASINIPHIEVVALTKSLDKPENGDQDSPDDTIKTAKRLTRLLFAFYRLLKIIRDSLEEPPDFPDVG